VFHRPGECDLTTNVDFGYLAEALAERAMPLGPLRQDAFLDRMGLALRAQRLIRGARDPARAKDIESATKRLTDGTGMGSEYKVLGVVGREATTTEDVNSSESIWPFMNSEQDTSTASR
jgi:NADH dehydrogenase [ubiquinone] 1 alpha subcomplex assembly factor 7